MKESPRAAQAWADYLAMGPGRSLTGLLAAYQTRTEPAPTKQLTTLKQWSTVFGWQERLKAIADQAASEAAEKEAEYRRTILEMGYGLAHERVKSLKDLAGRLYGELTEDGRLWVKEPKLLGSGDAAELVSIERFNYHEVEQFRGLLDDIAKEKKERKEAKELSGPDGRPIEFRSLSDEELDARIAELISAE